MHRAPFVFLVATLLFAAHARADALAIDTAACPSLNAAEIDRRVQLELADVARAQEGAGVLRVSFACDGEKPGEPGSKSKPLSEGSEANEVTVTISDPVTDKRVERRVPMPPPVDRERVLALVASQLFVTSWLELLTQPSPEARPMPANPPSAAILDRARETATARTRLGDRDAASRLELGFGGLVDLRSAVASPLRLIGAFVRPSLSLTTNLRFDLASSFAVGQAARARGVVDATLATLGVGLGFRSSSRATLAFEGHVLVALGYVRAVGNATSDSATDASAHAFFLDLSLAAGPSLRLGSTYLSLELASGFALPKLRGAVAQDADVTLSGLWIGARLSLAAGWGAR